MASPSSFSFYVEFLSKKKTTTMIQTLYFLIFYSFREGLASENEDTYSNSTRLSSDSVVNDHLPRCHVQDDFSFSTFPKPKQEFMSLIWCPLKHVSPRTYVMVSTKTCLHKVQHESINGGVFDSILLLATSKELLKLHFRGPASMSRTKDIFKETESYLKRKINAFTNNFVHYLQNFCFNVFLRSPFHIYVIAMGTGKVP